MKRVLIQKAQNELISKINEIIKSHNEEIQDFIQELALKYDIPKRELTKLLKKGN
jgi:hypothetical protein